MTRGLAIAVACLPLLGAAADDEEPGSARTPLAEVDGRILYKEDLEGAVAFRIYRHEVDIYSLLEAETQRRVDEMLLAREAERRGLDVDALLAQIEDGDEPASDAEVGSYLAEHPAPAGVSPDEARARVRHYLSETRRIERRLAFLADLREQAGFRMLLERPVAPRTEVDVAGAPARGPEDAPVTIVHFATFSSRQSARSAAQLSRLMQEFPGRIRWVHRTLLDDRDERGLLASRLGFIAQDDGRFWDLHDRWFARGGKLGADEIAEIAVQAGLDASDVERARRDPELLQRVKRDLDAARAAGAPREPTLFVNGLYVAGISPYEEVRDVVVGELKRTSSSRADDSP